MAQPRELLRPDDRALLSIAEISRRFRSDGPDEPALLRDLVRTLADAGFDAVLDVDDGRGYTRYATRARSAALDAVLDRHAGRAMAARHPILCHRASFAQPSSGPSECGSDSSTLRELAEAGLDWVLSVALDGNERALGALTAYAPIDEPTLPSITLVGTVAELVGTGLLRRRERAALMAAVEQRDAAMATIAHDLRSPIGIILTTARLLRPALEKIDGAVTGLGGIERQATRMLLLVQDVLESTLMGAAEFALNRSTCSVTGLIGDAIAFVEPLAAPKEIHMTVAVASDVPIISVDARRIEQVLVNLLGNAIKFTPPGGSIEVGCDRRPGAVAFVVRDNGPGIRPEHVPHVLERFWRADATCSGAGLGLTIARDVVKAHGGTIWVESEPGHGARFVFTIPLEQLVE